MDISAIQEMTERELSRQLGQFLYHSINEPWLSATLTLTCTNAHIGSQSAEKQSFICSGFYTREYHPETGSKVKDIAVTVSPFAERVFQQLFSLAQAKSDKVWAEAVFTIERSGQFKLTFADLDGHLTL
ncbi:hypothetical protein [Thalassotalea ganghwensis]